MPRDFRSVATLALAIATLACSDEQTSTAYADTAAFGNNGSDSAPREPSIEELLARFRETVRGSPPSAMRGERSKEALVRRFVDAVERSDTNALRDMALDRGEFAYLYYPESPFTHRPYRQDPALLWFMIQEGSNKGLTRLMNRHGGEPLGYVETRCHDAPDVHGTTRLWPSCMVRLLRAPGDTVELLLFGSIVERDGRFKFMSYRNSL